MSVKEQAIQLTNAPLAEPQLSGDIVILGALNVDYVFRVKKFPSPGETNNAESFKISYGGKGANAAVFASRYLNADSCLHPILKYRRLHLLGMLGADGAGDNYYEFLKEEDLGDLVLRINTCTVMYACKYFCGFCSNRILLYFPMAVSQSVTGVTSQVFSII